MWLTKYSCFLVFLAVSIQAWGFDQLSVKGFTLGQPSSSACEKSINGIKTVDAALIELQKTYPGLKPSNSTSCEINIDTFANQPIKSSVLLLFLDDQLIQLMFSLTPLDWGGAAALYTAVEQSYGKTNPFKTNQKTGFVSRVWTKGGQVLELSRPPSNSAGNMEIEVILRDLKKFALWENQREANKSLIAKQDAKQNKADTR